MKELQDLLERLTEAGAPARVIEELEMLIEKRALRILRHEEEIRRWYGDKEKERIRLKQEKDEDFDLLLVMLLILILDSDRATDEFRMIDLMPFIQDRQQKDSLAEPDWDEVEVKKTDKPKM